MVVDVAKWERRLRSRGWHRTPGGLVVPLYSIRIGEDEVDKFVEYLFIRALAAYHLAAKKLGVKVQAIAKPPYQGKSTELHRRAYSHFNRVFGHIRVRVRRARPISKYYKYGLILSDGSIVNRNMLRFGSSRRELVAVVLRAFKKAKIYVEYPVLLDGSIIHPFLTILVKNEYGTMGEVLRQLEEATPTQLFDYAAGLTDGDGTIHERNGIRIAIGRKKLDIIKPIKWMGKLHKDGKNTYKFTIYKEFQKAILPRLLHREKRTRLKKVLERGYRRLKIGDITIKVRLRRGIELRFYGDIERMIKYAEENGLKPRIHKKMLELPAHDALKLIKIIINPQIT